MTEETRPRRRHLGRRIARYFLVAAGLVAALLALVLGLVASDRFLTWALPWGAAKAGFVVELDDIRHDLGRELVLDGLRVRHAPSPAEQDALLTIERTALTYHLLPALRGGDVQVALVLEGPEVAVIFDENGRLPWLPEPSTEESPAPEETSPATSLIPSLPVAVLLDGLSLTSAQLRVVHPPSATDLRVRDLNLAVTASTREARAEVKLDLADAQLPADLRLGPLAIIATIEPSGPLVVKVDMETAGSFREEALQLDLEAIAGLTGVEAMQLAAHWAGLTVTAEGGLDLEASSSDLGVHVHSPDLGFLAALAEGLDIQGEALDVKARVTGDPMAPVIEVTSVSLPSLSGYDAIIDGVEASARFDASDGALSMDGGLREVRMGEVSLGAAVLQVRGDLTRMQLQLGLGEAITAAGFYVTEDAQVDLDLTVRQLLLDPIFAVAGLPQLQGVVGDLHGRIQGPTGDLTQLEAALELVGLEIEGAGLRIYQPDPMAIALSEGIARATGTLAIGTGRFELDAQADLGARSIEARTDGQLELTELADLARSFVPQIQEIEGRLELAATAQGSFESPGIDAEVSLAEGRVVVAGRSIHDLSARVRVEDDRILLEEARLLVEDLAIEATGSFDRTAPGGGAMQAELTTVDGRLEQIPDLAELGISGALDLQLRASGSVDAPVATAALSLPRIEAKASDLGGLSLEARFENGQATASGALPGGGSLDASADLGEAPAFDFELTIPELDLTPYIDVVRERLPEAFQDAAGTIALDVQAAGPLDDATAIQGAVVLGKLDIRVADTPIRLDAPTTLRIEGERFDLERLRLTLAESYVDLSASGTPRELEANVALDLDPATLDSFVAAATLGPGKISGELSIEKDDAGTRSRGAIDIALSGVEARAYPYAIENIEGRIQLDGPRISLEALRAKIGDGELSAHASFDADTKSLSNTQISFIQIPYRIPDALRVLTSGEITADGSLEDELRIAGTIRLDEVLYEQDVNLLGAALMPLAAPEAKQSAGGGEARPEILEHIRLDLQIQQGDHVRIKNNVAHMDVGVDLTVQGTAAAPRVLGEVNVLEGKINLFSRVFEIQRGAIHFNNPVRIDPAIDIETLTVFERSAERAEVTLRLEGVASEGIALELSSIPSYDDADILFLLATGKTRSEALAGGDSAGSPSGMGAALAALNLLGGDYAKETLGVDEISAEETDAGNAKITVGKQIDERMAVRASRETGSDPTTALAVEYKLTNNALVVAEPKDDGSVSLELRYRLPIR